MIKPLPLILDTDIGSDIDDSWALAMILKSPELDLRLVTTTGYNIPYQTRVAAKLLECGGRTDVKLAPGRGGEPALDAVEEWLDGYDISTYPNLMDNAVDAMIDTVMNSDEKITILCIGCFKNLADAYEKCPEITKNSRLVVIGGNIYNGAFKGWHPDLGGEWNIRCDLDAWRRGIENTDWEVELLPLDVSGGVLLDTPYFERIRKAGETDRLIGELVKSNDVWFKAQHWDYHGPTSPLFDTVGVYACITHENLNYQELPIYANDKSVSLIDPVRGKMMNVALTWDDKEKFYRFLTARLCGEI